PIATAYAAEKSDPNSVWHRGLQQAFLSILERHQITRRHAAFKKIEQRWPDLARKGGPLSAQ
ncbi:MAG: hypothetical protein LBQ09_06695, partial [Acidobacteriaceae bacterium]|nr:hypothetical protein [Acidobacteriaceae bacterium]